jgi:hypothetical protein
MVMQLFGLTMPSSLAGPFLVSGNTVYVGRGCLEEAIDFCVENNLVIIGMEGVTTDGSSVIPTLDFIADFGEISGDWNERVRVAHAAARLTTDQWVELRGFEFVALEALADQE